MTADLRRLLALASDAPWQWLDSGGDPHEGDELQDGRGEMVASGFRDDLGDNFAGEEGLAMTDGRLCAAMRNALPALLAVEDAARPIVEWAADPESRIRPEAFRLLLERIDALRAALDKLEPDHDH